MSPVNSRIPLQVRSPQIANPLDIVAGLQRARHGEQEQQINALQLERAQQQQTAQQQEAQENSQGQQNANLIKAVEDDRTATEAIFHLDDNPEAIALFQKYRDQPEAVRKIVD